MKALKFTVTIEGLPDHAKDYHVQGNVCRACTDNLHEGYLDGQVVVTVSPPMTTPGQKAKLPERLIERGGS